MINGEIDKAEKLYKETLAEQMSKMRIKANTRICDSLVVIDLKKMEDVFLLNNFRRTRYVVDSIFSQERRSIVEDMHVKYETEQKEKKIAKLAYEKLTLQIQVLITLMCLGIVVGVFVWLLYRNRQRKDSSDS